MKKNLKITWLFVILQMAFFGNLKAQIWTTNTVFDYLTTTTNYVSIGKTTANFKLDVTSGVKNDGIEINQTGATAASLYLNAAGGTGRNWGIFSTGIGNSQGSGHFVIRDIASLGDRFFIDGSTGYVGIRTNAPAYEFDVKGSGHISKKLHVDDQVNVNWGGGGGPARFTTFDQTGMCFYGKSYGDLVECAFFESGTIGALGVAGTTATGTQQQSVGLWGMAHNLNGGLGGGNYYRTVGVHGDAYAGNGHGYNAGVHGSGYSFNQFCTTYGVLGDIDNNQGCGYAGYFNGDLGGVGTFSYGSDRKFKENIAPIENAIEKIKQLQPSSYTFKQNEFPYINFSTGTHYGFIAQELEKVFPEVVKNDIFPPRYDDKGNLLQAAVEYKGVAYLEVIPILAEGIKEQQAKIEQLENKINELQNLLAGKNHPDNNQAGNVNTFKGSLLQNVPNPFDKTTRIDFSLPQNWNSAFITVMDMQGKELQRVMVSAVDKGSVIINSANFKSGEYIYALFVNGEKADQKHFVVVK